MDCVFFEDLRVYVRVGVYPEEQLRSQGISMDLKLYTDLSRAAQSDRLDDTIDYSAVESLVAGIAEHSSFQLLERLAGAIGSGVLAAYPAVEKITVTLRKPRSARFARTLGVEITLKQKQD